MGAISKRTLIALRLLRFFYVGSGTEVWCHRESPLFFCIAPVFFFALSFKCWDSLIRIAILGKHFANKIKWGQSSSSSSIWNHHFSLSRCGSLSNAIRNVELDCRLPIYPYSLSTFTKSETATKNWIRLAESWGFTWFAFRRLTSCASIITGGLLKFIFSKLQTAL